MKKEVYSKKFVCDKKLLKLCDNADLCRKLPFPNNIHVTFKFIIESTGKDSGAYITVYCANFKEKKGA